MLRRIFRWGIGLPIVVILVALGLANDQPISLVLDPFRPGNPAIATKPLPFFYYLFGALTIGVVIGGLAARMAEARWRRRQGKGGGFRTAAIRREQPLLLKPDP